VTRSEARRLAAMTNISEVREYLARTMKRSAPVKAMDGLADRREIRRQEHVDRMADLRRKVVVRSHGCCEFCGASMHAAGFELHHVIGGSSRQAEERDDTVAGICLACHRAWHGSDPIIVLRNAMEWALRNGFRDALRAIEKRIAKVAEAK
jgi:hypothetical protein